MKKNLIIDGNSLFFRSFYANQNSNLSYNGIPTNGVYTFANILLNYLNQNDFYDVKVAFDKGKKTFRHLQYKDYKGTRSKTPDNLIKQLPLVREFLEATGIGYYELDDYEADDIVGCFAKKSEKEGFETFILSSDKDLYQLITSKTKILKPVNKVKEYEVVDETKLLELWNISPKQVPDLKGLMGDSSDNIPGVRGIGEKTAINLISQYGTVEELYENIENIKGSVKEKLVKDKKGAEFSKLLATIITDINELENETFKKYNLNILEVEKFFKKYNMNALIKKFCSNNSVEEKINYKKVDLLSEISFCTKNYLYIELLNDDYHEPDIVALCISNEKGNFYFDKFINDEVDIFNWQQNKLDSFFQKILLDDKTFFEVYDLKKTIYALEDMGYSLKYEKFVFDTMSAYYVLDPVVNAKPHSQINILNVSNFYIENDEDIFGRGVKRTKHIDSLVKENYIIKKTFVLFSNTDEIINKLKINSQWELFSKIDMPLNFVLLQMEKNGVTIDIKELDLQTKKILQSINNLELEIKNLVSDDIDENFNISSPKQIKDLLFEKLKLRDINKGSTDRETLEFLQNDHPVVQKILEHRKLQKLYTTYLKGFKKYIKKNKVYTKFNQNLTNTGRLSSSDPNLQNISVRDELQKEVRKIFVTENNNVFFSFDYSQIELRVVAQMAQDQKMLDIFKAKGDIHENAARQIFNIPSNEHVSADQRRVAKVFNFGIIYGLSDYGLSRDLKISVKEAKEYIDLYFQNFYRLKEFKNELIEKAIKDKYAKTLSNRTRRIFQLEDPSKAIRNFGERIAVNMPVQGTAADIIKVAMINIYQFFKDKSYNLKMIAQIHDELIFEIDKVHLDEAKEQIENIMKNAFQDLVKIMSLEYKELIELDLSYSVGQNWFELK